MKNEEFNERVAYLQTCSLLKAVSLFTLIPIANNLVLKKFKLGQIILNAGEIP